MLALKLQVYKIIIINSSFTFHIILLHLQAFATLPTNHELTHASLVLSVFQKKLLFFSAFVLQKFVFFID